MPHEEKEKFLARHRVHNKRYRIAAKEEAIFRYSYGLKQCLCCGEKRMRFLSIDHIIPIGNKQRNKIDHGSHTKRIYEWLSVRNYPPGYAVLCMNCNFGRGHFDYCPHVEERRAFGESPVKHL